MANTAQHEYWMVWIDGINWGTCGIGRPCTESEIVNHVSRRFPRSVGTMTIKCKPTNAPHWAAKASA